MDLDTTILTYLTSAPTSDFNGMNVRVLDHWRGRDHLLWRVRANPPSGAADVDAVLKLYLDAGQARSRRQFDGQACFWQQGIAPRPLWYDRHPHGLARQVLIYEWAEGDALDAANSAQIAAHARSVARLHANDASGITRFSPHPLNLDYLWQLMRASLDAADAWLAGQETAALRTLLQQLAQAAATLVRIAGDFWRGVPPAAVHGDLRLENAVHGANGAILLDWEMFGLGDAAQEVARFLLASQSDLDDAQQEHWLDAYLAGIDGSAIAPSITQRVGVYQRLLALSSALFIVDGLRRAQPDDLNAAAAPELATVLAAAVQQAADAFKLDAPNIDTSVRALLSRLAA